MDKEKIWSNVLENLKLTLSSANFATWFNRTFITEIKEIDEIRQITEIGCPSSFISSTVENRYYALIKEAIDQITKKKNDLVFVVKQSKEPLNKNPKLANEPLFKEIKEEKTEMENALKKIGLKADFTFDSFAVSSSNQMAHAAALAVAQTPAKAYNPLFLYGGVGVGKTHLIQAIAHEILKKNNQAKIIYCMGEEFTNEIINAIREKATKEFKEKYRSTHLLMVDDIQFIAGKNTVQEEFFHTFNAIWRAGGQIVLTSDRRPEEISKLEDRLRSRFEGGLIIDIQPPDFELRTAILLIKAQQKNIQLPMDAAQLIASNITSIRKMEGFLTRLISEVQTKKVTINPDLITAILGQTNGLINPQKLVKPKEVLSTVANFYNLRIADLTNQKRDKKIVVPRQISMYLLRNDLKIALMDIGRFLGDRDHTTIMHGVEKITRLLPDSEDLRVDIMGIRKKLYG
ncbi:MAG: chromosomal replication initiator protein DnaA [Candidatus Shapirobacteria bacterium]|nr:chromosomal replication initiator protein DnaA [Candidatus Shapirobacteria bacterium]